MVITQHRLKELLSYDPESGIFVWRDDRGNRAKVGQRAGRVHHSGYRIIKLDSRDYQESSLAHLYMTGEWPGRDIDHKDLDRANNRWTNLRLATRSQNNANRSLQRNNQSGYKGASFHKASGKWEARIRVNGKLRNLGLFSTPKEAHAVYLKAANDNFGEFARVA